ncbi:MAG: ORF6N domain-containing protein [Bacteroidota bacterium]
MLPSVPEAAIVEKIHLIRGQKVMLDQDLAALYGIETKAFNQAVKRNLERFPEDFMFELTHEEFEHLRSQNVTSTWGGRRYLPNAITASRFPHPASRVPSPDSRIPHPASRVPSPASRVPPPASRLPRPASRLPSPESRV